MSERRYRAYGLRITSDIALPELAHWPDTPGEGPADVSIRQAQVEAGDGGGRVQAGPLVWAARGQLWLDVPGVARFAVSGGREIAVEPVAGVDPDSVRLFLLGSAFGALLIQRGMLVLHGNALHIGEDCVICVGASGAGKSTLAAALARRGLGLLADDVVPVDTAGLVRAGFPRIKLWKEAADRMGIDTAPLARVRPGIEKFSYPVAPAVHERPLRVRAVYDLSAAHVDGVSLAPVTGMQRFETFLAHSYRRRFIDSLGMKAQHLKLCGVLAGQVRLVKVTRPRRGFEIDGLADAILDDFQRHR